MSPIALNIPVPILNNKEATKPANKTLKYVVDLGRISIGTFKNTKTSLANINITTDIINPKIIPKDNAV